MREAGIHRQNRDSLSPLSFISSGFIQLSLSLTKMAAREEEQATPKLEESAVVALNEDDDDEHDSKERVLQRYFLHEWKLVKSLLDDIVSSGRVSDLSSVHKIRTIVTSLSLSPHYVVHYILISLPIGVKLVATQWHRKLGPLNTCSCLLVKSSCKIAL